MSKETIRWSEPNPGVWRATSGGLAFRVCLTSQVQSGVIAQQWYTATLEAQGPWGPMTATEKKQTLTAAQAWCLEQVPRFHDWRPGEVAEPVTATDRVA